MRWRRAALGALAAVALLAGCGRKDAPPAAADAPAPAVVAGAPLKVAFAYVGPVGDGGWTYVHDRGRQAIEREFDARVQTSYVEKVPEAADAERVFRYMAGQGAKLIFGTTFGYMEPMLRLAANLKDVRFEHATGHKTAGNLRSYDSRTYEGAEGARRAARAHRTSQGRAEGRQLFDLEGPIVDSSGREVPAADTTADDRFLGGIRFYLKGVEGQVPGAK